MIVYDMVMNVLDTKWFLQHNIAGLISGITFIVLFQSGEASTVEENTHTHRAFINYNKILTDMVEYFWILYQQACALDITYFDPQFWCFLFFNQIADLSKYSANYWIPFVYVYLYIWKFPWQYEQNLWANQYVPTVWLRMISEFHVHRTNFLNIVRKKILKSAWRCIKQKIIVIHKNKGTKFPKRAL